MRQMTTQWLVYWDRLKPQATLLGVDPSGVPTGIAESLTLADIKTRVAQESVRVILPAVEGLLTHIEIPAAKSSQIRNLLLYAIEDRVAQDVEDLQIAFTKLSENRYKVGVIAKDKLTELFNQFNLVGIAIRSVALESDLLPEQANETLWVIRQGQFLVVEPGQPPLVIDVEPLEIILASLLGSSKPSAVLVIEAPFPKRDELIDRLEQHYARLTARESVQGLEAWLAPRALQPQTLNLAQDEFSELLKVPINPQRLLPLFTLLCLLMILSVVPSGWQIWHNHQLEKSERQHLNAQIEAVHLPSVNTDIDSISQQLDSILKVALSSQQQGLLGGLQRLKNLLQEHPTWYLSELRLEAGQLDFTLVVHEQNDLTTANASLSLLGADKLANDNSNPNSQGYRMRVSDGQ